MATETKSGKRKRVRIILAAVGGAILLLGLSGIVFVKAKMKKFDSWMADVTISQPDFDSIADGTYTAKTDVFPIIVKLSVEIKNHTIRNITILKHQNGKGGDADKIVDDVIREQSLLVDTISGATFSSRVILKTIEKALE